MEPLSALFLVSLAVLSVVMGSVPTFVLVCLRKSDRLHSHHSISHNYFKSPLPEKKTALGNNTAMGYYSKMVFVFDNHGTWSVDFRRDDRIDNIIFDFSFCGYLRLPPYGEDI